MYDKLNPRKKIYRYLFINKLQKHMHKTVFINYCDSFFNLY
jgi:hypothetical protein